MIATDEGLLDRLRRCDDPEAWRTFFRGYAGPIRAYARKLGVSAVQADDVLQETLVILTRRMAEFVYDPAKGRFRNFVLNIVHKRSLEALRIDARHRAISLDREQDDRPPLKAQIAEELGGAEEREALTRWREVLIDEALRRMAEDRRIKAANLAILRAYVFEKRPMADIVAEFGVEPNAVYVLKFRLMARLRAEVGRLLRDSGSECE